MSDFRKNLEIEGKTYSVFDIHKFSEDAKRLPVTLKVLLENVLRNAKSKEQAQKEGSTVLDWLKEKKSNGEVSYQPSRVLMQDFTGVPGVVDLAAMRDAVTNLGGDPSAINPQVPVDLVIDHSVMVDEFGHVEAYKKNVEKEFSRNNERYEFLKWGQQAFENFRVVPPGMGICHQVNIEYLAEVVGQRDVGGMQTLFPDTLVGTDSHTTMVNGLACLGWGVGGIEAESAMLGQALAIRVPDVVGFKLVGNLNPGITATDLVLTVTQKLRSVGVVGRFVEFFGPSLETLALADRATLSNMAPEYGATCGFFPIDNQTLKYLKLTARPDSLIKKVEAYAKDQGMWGSDDSREYTEVVEFDLSSVVPSIAGPKRPQDRIELTKAKEAFAQLIVDTGATSKELYVKDKDYTLSSGDVVIAAITSCTNTSNPSVMVAAGLVAQKALQKGLKVQPWVKTSLAPGSQVVSEYLQRSGLQEALDQLGFQVVGYGCTTCIGNSGPLDAAIEEVATNNKDLTLCSVLSGNRNFEGRISPHIKANYLASPPLVVAYALLGSLTADIATEPLGTGSDGQPVYLKDIWPSLQEIQDVVAQTLTPEIFKSRYASVFEGTDEWKKINASSEANYSWNDKSTYIQSPPFFEGMTMGLTAIPDIKDAKVLALLGDSVTTDHISPAGNIGIESPAGSYLRENGIEPRDFNSFGSRRGNHEVMMRGTFGNIRLRNQMVPGVEGGFTKKVGSDEVVSIYDAAMSYINDGQDLVVIAGKEYGTGSSRDWAAKGTGLLGVKTVIAVSYERIHRSNLVGMGVLPLEFVEGESPTSHKLDGSESFSLSGLNTLSPRQEFAVTGKRQNGETFIVNCISRLDTQEDVENYKNGGILHSTIRKLVQ